MTSDAFTRAETALERAADLEAETALDALERARRHLQEVADDPSVDQERRNELETQIEQRIRQVKDRDAYDAGMGAAMNPEDDDAP